MILKRISAGIAAIALVGATTLGSFAPSAWAEPSNTCPDDYEIYPDFFSCRLVNYSGEPSGTELEVSDIDRSIDDQVWYHKFFGDPGYTYYLETVQEISDKQYPVGSNEFNAAIVRLFDRMELVPFVMTGMPAVKMQLKDKTSGQNAMNDGSEITIKYKFGQNPLGDEEAAAFMVLSENEWEPVVMEIDDKDNRSFLPTSIDENGDWTFTTTTITPTVFMAAMLPKEPDLDDLSDKIVDSEGLQNGQRLVARRGSVEHDICDGNDKCTEEMIIGEKGMALLTELEELTEELDDEDDRAALQMKYVDMFDYWALASGELQVDFHLEDDNHNKITNYSGEYTISFDYGFDPFSEDGELNRGFDEFFEFSSRKWEPAILHIKDDKTTELLPATTDGNGVWTFTTSSFSIFIPVIAPVDEEEAPKTLDNTAVFIGAAGASVAGMIVIGAWFGKKERR